MSPRRAQTWRGWAGRLAVLAAAALLGALVVRGLLGPSPGRDWAGELERTRGLAVDAVRWHAAKRTLGAARGRLWFTATAADDHHTDLWTGEAWQSPGGSPLWLGPVRRVTATPAGDERLLAADPERAVVRVGTLLRTVDASGRVLDIWRLEVPIEALRLVPELQAQREGRWGPLSEVAAPIRPIGPPPSEPIGRLTASPPPEGAPRPARWPPRAPWSALAESDGAAQRWDAGPVTVFAFHPQRFRAEYVWGAAGPVADDGQVGPGRPVEPAAVRITLSADAIGDAGLQLPEVAVRPLMRGAATLALDAEGRAGFGLWDGETPRTGLPWSTVLQRPWPLVVEGRVMPGQPRGDAAAALGVAGDGTWLYAAAQGEAGVALLGPTLQAAGAELALTVAREAAVAWHPKGVGGEFQAWLGDGAHRAADRAVAAGYLALRARPPRVLAPGWTPMGDEARPTWAARRQGGLRAWRLDDDHWRPSTQPEGLWWPHGPDAVPGVDGLRRDGATLRPMRARALTLCLGETAELVRWRAEDEARCPEARQGLTLVAAGRAAPGARGTPGVAEVGLGRDRAGQWIVAQGAAGDDRAALAVALEEAGAVDALLLGTGPPDEPTGPRRRAGERWVDVSGAVAPAPSGAGIGFKGQPGRATAAPVRSFERGGCDPRRVLLCD